MSDSNAVVQIGSWRYCAVFGQLSKVDAGQPSQIIRLEPRLHSLLNFFLKHPDTLLSKETLLDNVWPENEGSDAAVMRAVGALRKVLADDLSTSIYIQTIPKKGYRWCAPVVLVALDNSAQEQKANALDVQSIAPLETNDVSHLNKKTFDIKENKPTQLGITWKFALSAVLTLVLFCASLAYVLASFTASPLIKLPDTIIPISALAGKESWPLLSKDNKHVIYHYQAHDKTDRNWIVQDLQTLKVTHLAERYKGLSQAVWLENDEMVFRAKSSDDECHFYQQKVLPQLGEAKALFSCRSIIEQGAAIWQNKLLWLEFDDKTGNAQLFIRSNDNKIDVLLDLGNGWYRASHLALIANTAYVLASKTPNDTDLLAVSLDDADVKSIAQFEYQLSQLSVWDNDSLLLETPSNELQIFSLKTNKTQNLGINSQTLAQAIAYPGRVLAAQYLDYKTDFYQISLDENSEKPSLILTPWQVSNRSEQLLAMNGLELSAFVSNKSGDNQIWISEHGNSKQVSHFVKAKQLQQLLWHENELLVLLNSELYKLNINSAELTLFHKTNKVGRYASCDNELYWTESTHAGWRLMNNEGVLLQDVVDVRCGFNNTLVVQFSDDARLAILSSSADVTYLPVSINWRTQSAKSWFVDKSGIYWIDETASAVLRFEWQSQQIEYVLKTNYVLTEVYGQGDGLEYIVRQRPYDTDIVWLKNRR